MRIPANWEDHLICFEEDSLVDVSTLVRATCHALAQIIPGDQRLRLIYRRPRGLVKTLTVAVRRDTLCRAAERIIDFDPADFVRFSVLVLFSAVDRGRLEFPLRLCCGERNSEELRVADLYFEGYPVPRFSDPEARSTWGMLTYGPGYSSEIFRQDRLH